MRKRALVVTCMIMVLMAVSALATPEMVLVKAGDFQMGYRKPHTGLQLHCPCSIMTGKPIREEVDA